MRAPRRLRIVASSALLAFALALLSPMGAASAAAPAPASASLAGVLSGTMVPLANSGSGDAAAAVSTQDPVIIVVDTSGSMNDDDGNSTIKLTGAKKSIADIISGLSSQTIFGVWSYPAGASCSPGSYVYAPQRLGNGIEATAAVDAMVAVGDTPTGPALEGVAAKLEESGYSGATIVLISDGESNCGTPPCSVATDLINRGFQVTVSTIGFRTSQSGLDELRCVAEATGGEAVTADDSDQLREKLHDLMASQLSVSLDYVTDPLAGGTTEITATITLAGGEPARDVRTTLTYEGSADGSFVPVIPPLARLGNTDGTHALTTTWTVSTGTLDEEQLQNFTVSAWAANAPRVRIDGAYMTRKTSFFDDNLGELFEGVSAETPLVIFGDSYSAGTGAGPYQTPTDRRISEDCRRSDKTYLVPIFDPSEVVNLACHGAISQHLTSASDPAKISQLAQYAGLGRPASVAVLTFGGNDVGFGDFFKSCLNLNHCANAELLGAKLAEIDNNRGKLTTAYETLWSTLNTEDQVDARDGAFAPVIVLAYPRATNARHGQWCDILAPSSELAADKFATKLNASIKAAVSQARADGYEVYFVEDTAEAFLPNNSVCAVGDDAYMHGIVVPTAESVHPKDTGYQAITNVILQWSVQTVREPHTLSAQALETARETVAEKNWFWEWLMTPVSGSTTVDLSSGATSFSATAGGTITVVGSGYEPGIPVTLTLHSTPTVLGTLVAGEDGTISGPIIVPEGTVLGTHTIVTSALASNGSFREDRVTLQVIAPMPLWMLIALGGAAVLLVIALIIALQQAHRRRKAARATA